MLLISLTSILCAYCCMGRRATASASREDNLSFLRGCRLAILRLGLIFLCGLSFLLKPEEAAMGDGTVYPAPKQGKIRALYDVTWSLARHRATRRRDRNRLLQKTRHLNGKLAVITGANTGIGRSAAAGLAANGAHVILACRNISNALEARDYIIQEVGSDISSKVECAYVDLADLSSVDQFAREIESRYGEVSLLVNNAGVGGGGRGGITKDGIELNLGVNYVAHYILTRCLLNCLQKAAKTHGDLSRVINLSSAVHWLADIKSLDSLHSSSWRSTDRENDGGEYKRSKLFMLMLSRMLEREGHEGVISYAVNPGAVCSDIWRNAQGKRRWLARHVFPRTFKTCEQGALSILAACLKDTEILPPGSLVVDEKYSAHSPLADNPDLLHWLQTFSNNFTTTRDSGT